MMIKPRTKLSSNPDIAQRQQQHIHYLSQDRAPQLVVGMDSMETLSILFTRLPKKLGKAIVYTFVKEGTAIYIGSSQYGVSRTFSPTHAQKEARRICDDIFVCPCKSLPTARKLERAMIQFFQPQYNGAAHKRVRLIKKRANGRRIIRKDRETLDLIQRIKSAGAWDMMATLDENFDRWDRKVASQRSEAMPEG